MTGLQNYSVRHIPDNWRPILDSYIRSSGYLKLINTLHKINSEKGINLYNEVLAPLHLINPEEVRVVMLGYEPITKSTSPYLWVKKEGNMRMVYKMFLSRERENLVRQKHEKFRGSNYETLRRRERNKEWSKHDIYWRMRNNKEEKHYYSGILDSPPFQTYNWFKQGVLTLNINFTSDQSGNNHRNLWREFLISLICGLQKIQKNIVFTTTSLYAQDMAPFIDTGENGNLIVFQPDFHNYFTNINTALYQKYGKEGMINFLLNDSHKKEFNDTRIKIPAF